jgi:hypothetical protein
LSGGGAIGRAPASRPRTGVEVDAAQLDHAVAAAARAAQSERHPPALEHGPLDLVHPVDLPLLVARLLDVALVQDAVRPVLEAPDRVLEARDPLLLGDPLLPAADQLDLARDGVRGVVAGPQPDAAVLELGDLREPRLAREDPPAAEGLDDAPRSARPVRRARRRPSANRPGRGRTGRCGHPHAGAVASRPSGPSGKS